MRNILSFALTLFISSVSLDAVAVDEYPAQTVRIIVPFAPGAINDTIARMVSDKLATALTRTVIVENKPGAGSQIGTTFVAKAAPTGETLLFGAADGISVLPAIKPTVAYSVPNDFAFITRVGLGSFALVVSTKLPANTFDEFVRYAAQNPRAVRHGTPGNGSSTHMGAAYIEQETGIQLTHVHYQGMAGAVNDLVAGHIEAALVSPATIAPHVKSGKIKVLAVMGPSRHKLLADVPSIDEVSPKKLHVVGWWGFLAPAGVPKLVQQRLISELDTLLADKSFRARLEERGIEVAPMSGSAFQQFVTDDLAKWKSLSQRAKITLD